MATLEKSLALKRIMARVLKAAFTREELIYMRAQGVSLSDVIEGGYYDDESRADGQKMTLSLMSRWPLDDKNDLLVVYARDTANMITPRKELGIPNSDSLLENIGDLPAQLTQKLADLGQVLGFVETERLMYDLDGKINDEPDESFVEIGDPQITLDRPDTAALFASRFSETGSARWSQL